MRPSLAHFGSLALTLVASTACSQPGNTDASMGANYIAATERLHTAGQPSAAALASLAEQGFELVVNLAPPGNQGAVADEGKLVAEDGRPTSTSP